MIALYIIAILLLFREIDVPHLTLLEYTFSLVFIFFYILQFWEWPELFLNIDSQWAYYTEPDETYYVDHGFLEASFE